MRKAILSIGLLAIGASSAFAQNTTYSMRSKDSALRPRYKKPEVCNISVGLGASSLQLDEFNAAVMRTATPAVKDDAYFAFNVGFHYRSSTDRIGTDLNISALTRSQEFKSGLEATQAHTFVDFSVGYIAFENYHNLFMPSLGVGVANSWVNYQADMSNASFSQLTNLTGERNFRSQWGVYIIPKLTYEFKIPVSDDHVQSVGINLGYRVGLQNSEWRVGNSNAQKVNDAPKFDASGFIATVFYKF